VQPLHRSWRQYMQDLVALPGSPADLEARLYAAELLGCLIRVVQTTGAGLPAGGGC
jgi:hypothetical protein